MRPFPQSQPRRYDGEFLARIHRDQFPHQDKAPRSVLRPVIPVSGVADLVHTAGHDPWFWSGSGSSLTSSPLFNGANYTPYNPVQVLSASLGDVFGGNTPFSMDLFRLTIGARMQALSPDMPFTVKVSPGTPLGAVNPSGTAAVMYPYEFSGVLTRQMAVMYVMAVHYSGTAKVLTPLTLEDNPTLTLKQPYVDAGAGPGFPDYVSFNVQVASWFDPLTKRELGHVRALGNLLG